jgi:hypothetical protein
MKLPEGIGRREILIGAGILVIIAIIAVPLYNYSKKKSQRDEVRVLVESIRQAQLKQGASFPSEGYKSADWAPRHPTKLNGELIAWESNKGFTAIGWNPTAEGYESVHGVYRVAATRDSFTVYGRCDIDGDGEFAEFVADKDQAVKQTTDSAIY